MDEQTIEAQDQNVQAGPDIVTEFVRKISADQTLDKGTAAAIETLHAASKLTANNLLKTLENARGDAKHGPPTKA